MKANYVDLNGSSVQSMSAEKNKNKKNNGRYHFKIIDRYHNYYTHHQHLPKPINTKPKMIEKVARSLDIRVMTLTAGPRARFTERWSSILIHRTIELKASTCLLKVKVSDAFS